MVPDTPNSQPSRRPPPSQAINFVIDLISLLVLLALAATGLLLKYVLPPGSRGGRGLRLWDMTRHEWGDIHFWLSIVLAVLVIVHLALHWTWVCAVVARWVSKSNGAKHLTPLRRSAYGVAFLIAVVALLWGSVWLAGLKTTSSGGDRDQGGGQRYRGGRGAAVLPQVAERAPAQ